MTWIRELFLGNWRNKSVALFFAMTIWFVVFQAEKQDWSYEASATILPADPDAMIITRVERFDDSSGEWIDFEGRVKVIFSGPRKQIEDLKQAGAIPAHVEVAAEVQLYTLVQDDFSYEQQGVVIAETTLPTLRITQEAFGTRVVGNLGDHVVVTDLRAGWEIAQKEVEPNEVTIHGPKSVLSAVAPNINISMGFLDRFREDVDITLGYPESLARLVNDGKVQVFPRTAAANVALKASTATLAAAAVRVTFRMPALDVPIRIKLEDVAEHTIPVEFFGPKDQVSRLQEKLKDADFSVGVLIPALDLKPGEPQTHTFTEADLELYDFPSSVQKRPHPDRSPRPWTYQVEVSGDETK